MLGVGGGGIVVSAFWSSAHIVICFTHNNRQHTWQTILQSNILQQQAIFNTLNQF
jgi:hypothetical protein